MFEKFMKMEGLGDGGAAAGGGAADPGAGGGGGAENTVVAPTIPENWKDALDAEFRSEASLGSIKSLNDMAKSFIHAQRAMGSKVNIPDAKLATDKDWSAFYQRLGLPADPKEYKVTGPKDMDMGEEFLAEFTKAAHSMNILPSQAEKLLNWYAAQDKLASEKHAQDFEGKLKADLDGYKTKMGNGYEKAVTFANKVLQQFGGEEAMKFAKANPSFGANPMIIDLLSKIGQQVYGEDNIGGGEDNNAHSTMTPDQARAKRNEIMGDNSHPYWNSKHPNHQEAVMMVNKLIEAENPGQ